MRCMTIQDTNGSQLTCIARVVEGGRGKEWLKGTLIQLC